MPSTSFGSPLTPLLLRGGFCFGVFAYFFCLKYRKKHPKTKNGGYENGGLLTLESPLTPLLLRGGFCFGGFCLFFALNIGKNTPNKKRGLRKRGFVDSRIFGKEALFQASTRQIRNFCKSVF